MGRELSVYRWLPLNMLSPIRFIWHISPVKAYYSRFNLSSIYLFVSKYKLSLIGSYSTMQQKRNRPFLEDSLFGVVHKVLKCFYTNDLKVCFNPHPLFTDDILS
nr:MAG TPA: hypothetical protein [Caudoviricetes sp.]